MNGGEEAGLATYLEVATAENASLTIDRTSARLRGQQLVAVISLIKSLGGDWLAPNKKKDSGSDATPVQ